MEKKHKNLPSKRDEALFRCNFSREIPGFLMSLESVLDTLEATQEVHQHTCLDARGTPRVQAQLKKSPVFLLLISRRRSISLLCRERIPGIPITPQGEAVSTLTSSGTPGVLPQFHKTLISQSTPYIPGSHGMTRRSHRG